MSDWRPIATAPRDGTIIEVFDEDCGRFEMRWTPSGFNEIVSLHQGIWECPSNNFTWSEDRGFGPKWWRPLPAARDMEANNG